MDPRTNISHDIEIGNVYEDDRSDELYRLLYIDDTSALLRCEDGATMLTRRDEFEKQVGASRYSYKPDATVHGARAADTSKTFEFTEVDGIGATTADNLRNAGYSTKSDVRSADRDDLLSVGGVGQTNLDRLLDRVG